MRVKIIVVEPKYQVNLGYIARTAMNFGVKRLFVVSPRARLRGEKAKMYAKHAYVLLQNAKVYKSLDEATRNCSLLVGTTGIREKAKANFHRIFFAEEAVRKIRKLGGDATVGLLIGRDDTGLTREEMERCDMLAYISTDPDYPVLNISHALAIFLYLLRRGELKLYDMPAHGAEMAGNEEMKRLFALFEKQISNKRVRNKKAVLEIFTRLVRNTQPNRQELHALITALK